jgi:hypothetical protein
MTHQYFAPRLEFFGPSRRAVPRDAPAGPRAVHADTDREVRREVVHEPRAATMRRRYEDPDRDDAYRPRERDDQLWAEPPADDDDVIDVSDDALDVSDDVLDVTNDVLTMT